MLGFSIFLILYVLDNFSLGFSLQAGNLESLPDAPTTSDLTTTTGTSTNSASSNGYVGSGFGETEKTLNIAFGYVRSIAGLVLLVFGIIGAIWGIFKKEDDDEEEEEPDVIVTTK